MKKRNWLLFLLAVVLVLGSSIGTAVAYFTTYVTSRGGYVIHLGNETTIEEPDVTNWTKRVTIKNTADASEPGKLVFVRARAYVGAAYESGLTYEGASWLAPGDPASPDKGDGFYYYYLPLAPQQSTTELLIKINNIPVDAEEGDIFNVVVVYESVPAVLDANGAPDLATAWATGKITVITEGGNS